MALQGEGVGEKYFPLHMEGKIIANAAHRPVKNPFLAQIYFSWNRYILVT